VYQGWADPVVNPQDTINYVEQVKTKQGTQAELDTWQHRRRSKLHLQLTRRPRERFATNQEETAMQWPAAMAGSGLRGQARSRQVGEDGSGERKCERTSWSSVSWRVAYDRAA